MPQRFPCSRHSKNQSHIVYTETSEGGWYMTVSHQCRLSNPGVLGVVHAHQEELQRRDKQQIRELHSAFEWCTNTGGLIGGELEGAQPVDEKLPDWWACLRTLCTKRSLALSMLDNVDSASSITRTCIHSHNTKCEFDCCFGSPAQECCWQTSPCDDDQCHLPLRSPTYQHNYATMAKASVDRYVYIHTCEHHRCAA